MNPWILITVAVTVAASSFGGGYGVARLKYKARIAENKITFAKEKESAVTEAVGKQVDICETNKAITERTDHAAQSRINRLTAMYNAATNELRARSGEKPLCLSVTGQASGSNTAASDGTVRARQVDAGDILKLGYDGDKNGDTVITCLDFLDQLYKANGKLNNTPQ